jgi:hypothetical protein
MKLQFSLATLLVCMTVLAIVLEVSIREPVYEFESIQPDVRLVSGKHYPPRFVPHPLATFWVHDPGIGDVLFRVAWAGPIAIAVTLGALWAVRRLKSRRHFEPPVG